MTTLYTSIREQEIKTVVSRKRAAINASVDLIGQLDDEYKLARGARDATALEAVAKKYEAKNCRDTASRIRAEAMNL